LAPGVAWTLPAPIHARATAGAKTGGAKKPVRPAHRAHDEAIAAPRARRSPVFRIVKRHAGKYLRSFNHWSTGNLRRIVPGAGQHPPSEPRVSWTLPATQRRISGLSSPLFACGNESVIIGPVSATAGGSGERDGRLWGATG
jgi:hypothetical protein